MKQFASHLGGSRNPMIVSWPARIKHDDKPRDCFLHLVGVAPTIYEVAQGDDARHSQRHRATPAGGQVVPHELHSPSFQGWADQYFEILSNRSIYKDGWEVNAPHTWPWKQDVAPENWDKDGWKLYLLDNDFSEFNDQVTITLPDPGSRVNCKALGSNSRHYARGCG